MAANTRCAAEPTGVGVDDLDAGVDVGGRLVDEDDVVAGDERGALTAVDDGLDGADVVSPVPDRVPDVHPATVSTRAAATAQRMIATIRRSQSVQSKVRVTAFFQSA
jgi:hypothetical protein